MNRPQHDGQNPRPLQPAVPHFLPFPTLFDGDKSWLVYCHGTCNGTVKSLTVVAQRNTWHEVIGEATVDGAILDRVVHNAHRINMKMEGESMRKKARLTDDQKETNS